MANEVKFWYGCSTGKRMYSSKKEARRVRNALRHKKSHEGKDSQGLSVFFCDTCRHWHLGHLPYHVRRGLGQRGD